LRYRATKSILEIIGNIQVLSLLKFFQFMHDVLPYAHSTLCLANFESLTEIVTNFLRMFSTDTQRSKRSAELFYTSYNLYEIACNN
jgi:hypothetical protein